MLNQYSFDLQLYRTGSRGHTYKVSQSLGQMAFIQVDINVKQALEVLGRMRNEILSIRPEDPSMAVVDIRIFEMLALGRVQSDPFCRDRLPWSQRERARFNSISRSHQLKSVSQSKLRNG